MFFSYLEKFKEWSFKISSSELEVVCQTGLEEYTLLSDHV